ATPTKEEILGSQISFGPNPAGDALFVNSTVQLDRISISNMLGQQLISYEGDNNRLDISKLVSGMYLISFTEGNTTWTTRFVKK
ncbi:MAG: T9SS C-terminal target domain-containing protein, partial [Bacteroidetes bacterium]